MADREKVIKGLEYCTNNCEYMSACPYSYDCHGGDPNGVSYQLLADALALLREQEPTRWIMEPDRRNHYHCEKCGYVTGLIGRTYKFCPECGRKVKRDEADRC